MKGDLADQLASAYERLPMPDARDRYDDLGVGPENGHLRVAHTLSAEWREIDVDVAERDVADTLRALADPNVPLRTRFLTLWRLAPQRLSEKWPGLRLQPADTRCPDHTLWHHLDSTAAISGIGLALPKIPKISKPESFEMLALYD